MKFIVRKKIGSVTVQVDPQDAHLLRSFVWTVNINETGQTYLRRTQNGVVTALHREIMDAGRNELVRFRNGDQLDLRRSNLIKEPIDLGRARLVSNMLATVALKRIVGVAA